MMRRRWFFGLAVAAIVIGGVAFYRSAAFNARSGEDNPIYSSTRFDPYGTAALQELLSRRNIPVRDLDRPSLESDDHGVLIEVLPALPEHHLSLAKGFEVPHLKTTELAEWIAAGNVVIQFTHDTTDLMKHFGIAADKLPDSEELDKLTKFEEKGESPDDAPGAVETARYSLPGKPVQTDNPDGSLLSLRLPIKFAAKQNSGWKPIAWLDTDDKSVVAGEYQVGKGKLVVVGSTTPALNHSLGDLGNLDFILSEIGDNPVIFDEWSHGIGREATVMGFLRDVGLLPVLLQLIFAIALYVWSTSGLRREADTAAPRQRSSIEQIQTLGYLYSRALNQTIVFDRVRAEVQRRLAAALRCQPREIDARVTTLQGNPKETAIRLLERMQTLESAIGPRCPRCNYDLTTNQSGRCPECGTPIPPDLLKRVQEFQPRTARPTGPRPTKALAALAEVLTLSNQLSRELQRDRSAKR
jgi:hypothetical protein